MSEFDTVEMIFFLTRTVLFQSLTEDNIEKYMTIILVIYSFEAILENICMERR